MKFLNLATAAALAAGLAAAATPALAANLIVNGGFEAQTLAPGGDAEFRTGSHALTGWEVLGVSPANNVALFDDDYTEVGGTLSFKSFAGRSSIDISGGGNTGLDSGIHQRVGTVKDRVYQLSFWVGNANGKSDYNGVSVLDLRLNGGARQSFAVDAVDVLKGVTWRKITTTFTANGDSTDIAFLNGTRLDAYTGLDNISLTEAVPEPGSWALMITGFGLAGATLRRRRRLAAA